jgi:Xaa-Pro aminopeptidase
VAPKFVGLFPPVTLPEMDYTGRQRWLRGILPAQHLDVLLITHPPNIHYLCGFTGSAGVLLVSESKSAFFTDGRYTAQARSEVQGPRIVIGRKGPLAAAAEWLKSNRRTLAGSGKCRIGFEAEHLTVAVRKRLGAMLPSGFHLREAQSLVERARMMKEPEEIDRIREAVLLAASLFDDALKTIRPGTKETEVAAEMEYAARRAGAEQMAFETIIAAGQRSALPHGRASAAPIPAQGFVVCDFGVILAGYCSDMTRTVYVGRPSEDARKMYEAVREAQQAAVAAVRPGVSVGEVDQAARKLLQSKGFGRYFTHSTGHGVGLEVHEDPRVAAGQAELLRPGMIITIEPGAYIPGKWGVRIEDMVVVTESGCDVLTPTSKELITL